jgi:hypothetical protein
MHRCGVANHVAENTKKSRRSGTQLKKILADKREIDSTGLLANEKNNTDNAEGKAAGGGRVGKRDCWRLHRPNSEKGWHSFFLYFSRLGRRRA